MKYLIAAISLMLAASPALAKKSCEELKAEIEAKLNAKGVTAYTLEIVEAEKVKDEKVVGSCDGGTKKIIYKRGEPAGK
jgi:Protein of unknown function (DUF1161)